MTETKRIYRPGRGIVDMDAFVVTEPRATVMKRWYHRIDVTGGNTMTERNTDLMARALHDAYVRAVTDELTERGIRVADVVVDAADTVRRAELVVAEDDPMNTTWQDSESVVRLHWDERHGWSWRVRYPGEPQPRGAVHFGVSAVPQPTAVADWILISLVHPEAVASREDGPFATADLEAVLRAYAVR